MWGQLLSTGLSVGGGLLGSALGGAGDRRAARRARQANEGRYRQALGLAREQEHLTSLAVNQYLQQIGRSTSEANRAIDTGVATAKRDTNEQAQQAGAASDASLQQRGLYNTTTKEASDRDINVQRQRGLERIDIAGGQARSQVAQQQGQAQLVAADAQNQAAQRIIDIIAGRQDVATMTGGAAAGGRAGGALGGLLGNILGGLFDSNKDDSTTDNENHATTGRVRRTSDNRQQ